MGDQNTSGLSLFDLLARDWSVEGRIAQIVFNQEDSAALFRTDTGQLALASLKDAESPKNRTRLELETGRTMIHARQNPVAPLKIPGIAVDTALPVCRFTAQGFVAIDADGAVQQVTAGGQVILRQRPGEVPVSALCTTASGDVALLARGKTISAHDVPEMAERFEIVLDHSVTCQSVSEDGRVLAAWGNGSMSLIDLQDGSVLDETYEITHTISEITWNAKGTHLSCASPDKSFFIVDRASGKIQHVEGYPAPVVNTAFSKKGNALVTSGAFRLVGWSCDDLPQNDQPGTPLATGKPGLVVINTIAAHPKLGLVASGYANGLVAIAKIGTPDEMMMHQEADTEVSALNWSRTGEHLAIGFASGKVAIVTFPDQMFK